MEDKRGIKLSRSPSKEGIPSPSDTKTPPLAPSGSPPPLGFPSEISSHCRYLPVFEQGAALERLQWWITDVSWDEAFAIRLFGDLNHDVLGPPGDGKIIILSTPMKKNRRCTRRRLPAPKMWLLLLQSTLPQPPPSMLMMHLRGWKTIIVIIFFNDWNKGYVI
jgi:hypothetical protein